MEVAFIETKIEPVYGQDELSEHRPIEEHLSEDLCAEYNDLKTLKYLDSAGNMEVTFIETKIEPVYGQDELSEHRPIEENLLSETLCAEYNDLKTLKGERNIKSEELNSTTLQSPFTCMICDKSFPGRRNLQRHIKTHSNEKKYFCHLCDMKFTQKASLDRHTRIHMNVKPFGCNVCDKKFTQSNSLKEHLRIHSNEKPFSCNVCEKKFTQKSSLRKHLVSHTGTRAYSCTICNKSFTLSSTLQFHLKIHSDERLYQCTICNKSFVQSSNLKRHMRYHLNERPYTCNVCDKSFVQSSCLKNHMRIHTKERPFTCNVCHKTFIQNSNLSSHLRLHSGNSVKGKNKPSRKYKIEKLECNELDKKNYTNSNTSENGLAIQEENKIMSNFYVDSIKTEQESVFVLDNAKLNLDIF